MKPGANDYYGAAGLCSAALADCQTALHLLLLVADLVAFQAVHSNTRSADSMPGASHIQGHEVQKRIMLRPRFMILVIT